MSSAFILEMAWKSVVISGAALLVLALLRSRSAADRAMLLRLALALLLLLPLLSIALPSLVVEEPAAPAVLQPMLPAAPDAVAAGPAGHMSLAAVPERAAPALTIPTTAILQAAYLAGVVMVVSRLLAGLWTLRRWTRAARPVLVPAWRTALVRAGGPRVRLLVSDHAASPLSWGLRRPVILIDRASLGRPEDADAILAHEMAHVARRDWPALMLSRLAVALFWFNPLVWLLERCLVQHAEEAADLQAVVRVEPIGYARTLLDCVRNNGRAAALANAMAPRTGLTRRLGAVLDPRQRGLRSGSAWTAAAMAACIGVAAPVAALELVPAGMREATPAEAVAAPTALPDAAPAPARPAAGSAVAEKIEAARTARRQAFEAALKADEARIAAAGAQAAANAAAAEAAAAAGQPDGSRRETAAAEDVRDAARTDDTARASVLEIDPGYAEALAAAGYHNLSREQLRNLQVLDVSAAMVRRLAKAGYTSLTPEQLARMKIFDVSPSYVQAMASAGYGSLTPEQLVTLRMQRISPREVRQFAELGYGDLTPEQLVQLRIHSVTPDFVRDMASVDYWRLSPEQLVKLRIFGITSDKVRNASPLGRRLSPEALIELTLRTQL